MATLDFRTAVDAEQARACRRQRVTLGLATALVATRVAGRTGYAAGRHLVMRMKQVSPRRSSTSGASRVSGASGVERAPRASLSAGATPGPAAPGEQWPTSGPAYKRSIRR